jgi:hypothetical protein
MPRKRKTCECCRVRLQPDEDFWCKRCRAEAEMNMALTSFMFAELSAEGLSAVEIAERIIKDYIVPLERSQS